jgi:hypothetical protein
MLVASAWYLLPDGTRVRAVNDAEERIVWSLESAEGRVLYVIVGGAFRAITPLGPMDAENPMYVLAPCDLTIDDLTPESEAQP